MLKVEGNVTRSERFGLEDGLFELQIHAILQDSQRFLWIGTLWLGSVIRSAEE